MNNKEDTLNQKVNNKSATAMSIANWVKAALEASIEGNANQRLSDVVQTFSGFKLTFVDDDIGTFTIEVRPTPTSL